MIQKLFLLIALAIVIPAQAYAMQEGIAEGGTSCSCHGSPSPNVTATLNGPSSMLAGTTQTYTAFITQAGVGAGVNVALGAGFAGATLGDIDANTQILSDEIAHVDTTTGLPTGSVGDWSYDFTLTAPMTLGTIVLNAALNAFNGDGTQDGDLWNKVSLSVQVVPEPSTILLLGTGIASLAALGRRRRSHSKS